MGTVIGYFVDSYSLNSRQTRSLQRHEIQSSLQQTKEQQLSSLMDKKQAQIR